MKIFLSLIILLVFNQAKAQTNQKLINWFAGGDILGVINSEDELASDAFVREFEFSANAFIDHTWEGTLTLSKHQDAGESDEAAPEVHEAFIFSNKIVEKGHLKLGKFFLGFGRLNRFHRHDWVFTEAPYYHQQFFGTEGIQDTGIEYSKLLSVSNLIRVTGGITAGKEFVHSHDHDHDELEEESSENAYVPTHYLRISSFKEFSTTKGLEYGLNYVSRTDAEKVTTSFAGLDITFKSKVQRYVDVLMQAELYY